MTAIALNGYASLFSVRVKYRDGGNADHTAHVLVAASNEEQAAAEVAEVMRTFSPETCKLILSVKAEHDQRAYLGVRFTGKFPGT